MRIVCQLFGCGDADIEEYSVCKCCGAHLYSDDWIQHGVLDFLWVIKWKIQGWVLNVKTRLLGSQCEVCGKRYRASTFTPTCSKHCQQRWVPF